MRFQSTVSRLPINLLLALFVIVLGGCSNDPIKDRRQLLIGDWRIVAPESDGDAGGEMTLISDGTCSIDVHTGSWGVFVPKEIHMAGSWKLLDVDTLKFELTKSSTGDPIEGFIETWEIMSVDDRSLRLRKSTLSTEESGTTAWTRIK